MATVTPASAARRPVDQNPVLRAGRVRTAMDLGAGHPGKRGQTIRWSRNAGVPGSATMLGCSTPASALFSARPVGREHPTTARPSPSSKQLVSCSANADLSPPGAAAHPARAALLSQLQLIPISACEEGRSPGPLRGRASPPVSCLPPPPKAAGFCPCKWY